MARTLAVTAAFAGWIAPYVGSAQPGVRAVPPQRIVVPIHQSAFDKGVIRYSIPVMVGKTRVEAMLDTGSTGLRVLPGAMQPDDFTATGRSISGTFGSGARFKGVVAEATVEIGGLRSAEPVPVEAVQSVGCGSRKPHCAAGQIAPQDYRIGGGKSGRGFRAIIGVSLGSGRVANPLPALGVRSWIIVLPRPGDRRPGGLILNPDPQDVAGFSIFPVAGAKGAYDGIPGCLTAVKTGRRICAPATLDTGKPTVTVNLPPGTRRFRFRTGDSARLGFGNAAATLAPINFTVAAQGPENVKVRPARNGEQGNIYAGILPYFSYEVLFDSEYGSIGLKSRSRRAP